MIGLIEKANIQQAVREIRQNRERQEETLAIARRLYQGTIDRLKTPPPCARDYEQEA